MVNGVRFVASEEENLALEPEMRLDSLELLCISFVTVKKEQRKLLT